jgi:hypothetical protein
MILTDELGDNLSGGNRQDEQAVIVCLQFPAGKLQKKKALDAVLDLDDIFRNVLEIAHCGSYDGHEFSETEDEDSVTFYFYGQNANLLYKEIKPILQSLSTLPKLSILKRYAQFQEFDEQLNLH